MLFLLIFVGLSCKLAAICSCRISSSREAEACCLWCIRLSSRTGGLSHPTGADPALGREVDLDLRMFKGRSLDVSLGGTAGGCSSIGLFPGVGSEDIAGLTGVVKVLKSLSFGVFLHVVSRARKSDMDLCDLGVCASS